MKSFEFEENTVGVQMYPKQIGIEQKKKLMDLWRQWLELHK